MLGTSSAENKTSSRNKREIKTTGRTLRSVGFYNVNQVLKRLACTEQVPEHLDMLENIVAEQMLFTCKSVHEGAVGEDEIEGENKRPKIN
jgi:hypothetical protein